MPANSETRNSKTEGSPKTETRIVSVCGVVELVAPATSRAAFSGAPGTGERENRGLFVPPAVRAGLSQARQALPLNRWRDCPFLRSAGNAANFWRRANPTDAWQYLRDSAWERERRRQSDTAAEPAVLPPDPQRRSFRHGSRSTSFGRRRAIAGPVHFGRAERRRFSGTVRARPA